MLRVQQRPRLPAHRRRRDDVQGPDQSNPVRAFLQQLGSGRQRTLSPHAPAVRQPLVQLMFSGAELFGIRFVFNVNSARGPTRGHMMARRGILFFCLTGHDNTS
jgi:hypothetical protein